MPSEGSSEIRLCGGTRGLFPSRSYSIRSLNFPGRPGMHMPVRFTGSLCQWLVCWAILHTALQPGLCRHGFKNSEVCQLSQAQEVVEPERALASLRPAIEQAMLCPALGQSAFAVTWHPFKLWAFHWQLGAGRDSVASGAAQTNRGC